MKGAKDNDGRSVYDKKHPEIPYIKLFLILRLRIVMTAVSLAPASLRFSVAGVGAIEGQPIQTHTHTHG